MSRTVRCSYCASITDIKETLDEIDSIVGIVDGLPGDPGKLYDPVERVRAVVGALQSRTASLESVGRQ